MREMVRAGESEMTLVEVGPERISLPKKVKGFITVGVFTREGKRGGKQFSAYSRDYNPEWPGCCEHLVPEESRKDAKKIAVAEHRARCLPD